MFRQMHPGTGPRNPPVHNQPIEQGREGGPHQRGRDDAAQALAVGPQPFGMTFVFGGQCIQHGISQRLPARWWEQHRPLGTGTVTASGKASSATTTAGLRFQCRASTPSSIPCSATASARQHRIHRVWVRERPQQFQPLRFAPATGGRRDVEHPTAAERAPGRLVTQDESVAMQSGNRLLKNQLRQSCRAGNDVISIQHRYPGQDIRCAQMAMHRHPVIQGMTLGSQHSQFHIEPRRRRMKRGVQRPVAPMDVLPVQIRPGEVEGAALAYHTAFRRLVLSMDAAHPRLPPRG